jgi:CheY-like chemotaxis protein
VAAELDDMSGHDLVELLKGDTSETPIAMVVDATRGRRNAVDTAAATEAGADATLSHPISLADLERLLGLPSEERAREFGSNGLKSFVTLPVGIGAAVIAIAVLMIG